MLTSKFEYLRSPNFLTLCAGHGGRDSGAVSRNNVERENNIYTTERIASNLKALGISVYVVPHELDLIGSINHVNSKFKWGQTWAIEIHRDSASGISSETADKRVGVYGFGQYTGQDGQFYNEDKLSMNIARFMRDRMVQLGAEANSWARTDNLASFGRLGWIRDTNPLAHLLELGFVMGDNKEHLNWLSDLATVAIYEAFTGKIAPSLNAPSLPKAVINLSTEEKSILVLRNYNDLPININELENLLVKKDYNLVLEKILTTFRQQKLLFNQPKVEVIQKQPEIVEQNNSSSKPFWKSKKFVANLLSTIASAGLILWQTNMIKPDDSFPIIATKLGTAVVGVLGLSYVANQYIKSQGKVDEASFQGNIQQLKNSELQNFIRKNI
jgi:hypothetical protein